MIRRPSRTTIHWTLVSNDQHVYGEIMWPDGEYSALRPCVIMLHGFPGSARNDDIAHALCRIGCVVMVPHHRGAWGSEGKYLITHCIEDARNLVDYARAMRFAADIMWMPGISYCPVTAWGQTQH